MNLDSLKAIGSKLIRRLIPPFYVATGLVILISGILLETLIVDLELRETAQRIVILMIGIVSLGWGIYFIYFKGVSKAFQNKKKED